MINRANTGDRIILFTLVDLLIQIIFFGFFLFAANRASQGEVQDRTAALAQRFGVVSVTRFLNATSKLVAIADLGRVDTVATTAKSTETFGEATKMIEGLDQEDVRVLANMSKEQRRALTRMMTAVAPQDRNKLGEFLHRYGMGFVRASVAKGFDAEQVRRFIAALAKLPAGDRGKFMQLGNTFLKANPEKRKKIVDAAATLTLPTCFNDKPALSVTEVAGGYVVQPLIGDAGIARHLGSIPHAGQQYHMSDSVFRSFSAAVTGAHTECYVRVIQRTQTYDERQLKTIQFYYRT